MARPPDAVDNPCAREQIHIPGEVQPFGLLFVLDNTETIRQVGGRLQGIDAPIDRWLGRRLDDLIIPPDVASVRATIASTKPGHPVSLRAVHLTIDPDRAWEATLHRTESTTILEILEPGTMAPDLADLVEATEDLTRWVHNDEPFAEFLTRSVDQFRRLSRFDRVMIYRFDPEWNGEVIAESAYQQTYRGLRFPAGDIPSQARELYLRTEIRVLPDAMAEPVPLIPELHPQSGEPCDLSLAILRPLSASHREYLRNMGVRATLVVSIIVDQQLWGLLACHHEEPYLPSSAIRRLAASLARLLAMRIQREQTNARLGGSRLAQRVLDNIPLRLGEKVNFEAALIDPSTGLMELVAAAGIAVIHHDRVWQQGLTPDAADLRTLVARIEDRGEPWFATSSLSTEFPELARLTHEASGVLAVRFPAATPGWLIWFRPEAITQVTWAGAPTPPTGTKFTPRTSFAAWAEEVRGRARPWTTMELALVDEVVRPNLAEVLLSASLRREAESQADLRLMKAVVDTTQDGILITQPMSWELPGAPILYANPALQKETGYTADELIGQSPRRLLGSKSSTDTIETIEKETRASRPIVVEVLLYRKNRSTFWSELTINPLTNEQGQIAYGIAVVRNISTRKAAEAALEAERQFLSQVIDAVPGFVCVKSSDGRFLLANRAIAEAYGTTVSEMLNKRDRDFSPRPEEAARFRADEEHILQTGQTRMIAEEPITTAWGGIRYLTTIKLPLVTREGEPGILAVATDITERVEAERRLRESEARLRLAIEGGRLGTFDWDIETDQVIWSDRCYEILGYDPATPAQPSSDNFLGRLHPEDRTGLINEVQQSIASRRPYSYEYRVTDFTGAERWIAGYAATIYAPDGRPIRMSGVLQDITDRKRVERALAQREARLQQVLNQMPIGCLTKDVEQRYTSWNPACEAIFGWKQEEVLGRTPFETTIDPDTVDYVRGIFERIGSERRAIEGSNQNRTRDGRIIWCRWHNVPLIDEADQLTGYLAMVQDVTELQQASAAVAESLRLYRLLADNSHDVISIQDLTGKYEYLSPSCERVSGYRPEEMVGTYSAHYIHPEDMETYAAAHQRVHWGDDMQMEWRFRRKDGSYVWLETTSTPVRDETGLVTRVICSTRDVSSRRRVEEQLRQSQKLEAIGQLAGGVAHDFNNLLTVVSGCAELLLEELPLTAAHRSLAEEILRAAERGGALTRQMLAFSRQQVLKVEILKLDHLVRDSIRMLSRLLSEDVTLRTSLEASEGYVRADAAQIEQVLMNLVLNARDAMPRGGILTIATTMIEVEQDQLPPQRQLIPGPYLRLTVSDTGVGMTPDIQSRLFEPFFTTKPVGKGTGLGLATVYGIVGQARGYVTVESQPGLGSTFHVHIPASQVTPPTPSSALALSRSSYRGSETILVVEDDMSVRAVSVTVLQNQGYKVLAAESGTEAIELCRSLPAPPDLVLTDIVMPGMSGRELAEELMRSYPRLRVIFLSGYTADMVLRHGIEEDRVTFLQKPYTADGLSRLVRTVLDAES